MGGLGYGLFALGRASVDSGKLPAEPRTTGDERLTALRADNASLREQTAMLERTGQVERAAYDRISESLKELQDEVLRLTEELAVYKGIVVRSGFSKGIVIQSLKLHSEEQSGLYRYQVVLTHFGADKEVVSGSMKLLISGTQGRRTSVLTVGELANAQAENAEIRLQFRNFVTVEGLLHLPQNFAPQYVRVRVDGEAGQHRIAEKTFTWKQATS